MACMNVPAELPSFRLLTGVSGLDDIFLGCLYVTLSESKAELEAAAVSRGWSLDDIAIAEFVPDEASLSDEERYTVFHPGDVELANTIRRLLAEIEQVSPDRLIID
jgi:circadian clock protein KaiC